MALSVRIALLLGILSVSISQISGFKIGGSQRKEAKYGRPVLAMANSPRCMFNGRPVEDGRTVSSPEPCLNCTCSKGILLCYLRTCSTVVATPGCEVVRKKGECCPKLECRDPSEYRTDRNDEPNYKYRLRQDDMNFFGLIGSDPRTEKSNFVKTTRRPSPKIDYGQDDWMSSEMNNPSDEPQALVEQEEDYESDRLSAGKNDSAGYCYHKGYKYSEGMAMLSPTKCEYCYCIRGQQMCVRPKCHLNIDGCIARYQTGYTCCPSHYQCEIGAQGIDGDGYPFASTFKPDQLTNKVTSCNVEGYDFDVGVAVPSSGHCQTCYCTQLGVVCRRLECSPNVPGCTPIVPDGHCCPTEYKCDQQGKNETQVPVSHSTENYDVTVISPSEPETISSHTSETETTFATDSDYTESYTSDSYDQETTSDPLSDKQKITVELNQESNLESISVIPEENIAVLVVTTEKATDKDVSPVDTQTTQILQGTTKRNQETIQPTYLKEKSKSTTARGASTIIDGTQFAQDTTKPIIISLPNLKQKTKPTTTKGTTLTYGNWYTHLITRPAIINLNQKLKPTTIKDSSKIPEEDTTKPTIISLPNLKHRTKASTTNFFSATTKADKIDNSTPFQDLTRTSRPSTESTGYPTHEGTDNYNYDYADPDEDVAAPNKHETFAPFADYSEPAYGERLSSTEKTATNEKQQGTTVNMRFKNKNRKPPLASQTSDLTTFINSKFATEGLTTRKIIETETYPDSLIFSTNPVTVTDKSVDHPTRYTIYSVPSDKTKVQPTKEPIGNQKQKVKPNLPKTPLNTMYVPTRDTTLIESRIPLLSTRIYQNEEHQTTFERPSDDHGITQSNRPSLHTDKEPTVITSNHKQKPQRLSHTTTPYKSTQPLPQEIAELLWTITQKQNSQTQVTSTETYEPSVKQEIFTSKIPDNAEFSPENLSLVLAAPKLIVEDTTAHENYGTIEFETTNADLSTSEYNPSSESSVPNLMFNAPEIIFSNHGPSSYRKQPKPVRDYHVSGLQGVRGPGLPNLQTVKNSGLQTVKNPGLQSIKNSGLQTIKNSGLYGTQVVRDPSVSNVHTVKVSGRPNIITIRDPGFSDTQTNRNTSFPSIQNQKESGFPGLQANRPHDLPLEINNHKKVLRPRPPSGFRPPSTPSVPQSSIVEISNHRPINTFRRPTTSFPPYPSYNQRSEIGYRSQQNPRDPHHSLHYVASDLHPEWRDEDYDEYYYDFEQGRSPTKVFTNMQKQQTTNADVSMSSDTQSPSSQKTTRQHNLNLSTTTMKVDEDQYGLKLSTTDFSEQINETKSDEIESRSSDIKIAADTQETTTQTSFFTTSFPTSKQTITTSTKPSSTIPTLGDDDKLFRADDNTESSDNDFNRKHGEYEGKTNKFEVINGRPSAEKPVLRPISVLSETPIHSPSSEEDSKEINDVCFVDGRYYNSGEIIVKSNPCEMCRCFYGHPLCQVQQCPHPPEPSCVLEYLPGYCCPRVTCGVKMDSTEPPDISAPQPTSQEIKPPMITSDNQWKPLPHGPVVRPPESIHHVLTPSPETVPDVVTAPPQIIPLEEKTNEKHNKETELSTENSYNFENSKEQDETRTVTTTVESTTTSTTSLPVTTQSTTTTTQRIEITTYFPEITTEEPTETTPVIQPEPENNDSEENSDIHDNSSGVRKVLDETITLPPSKMSLSPNSGENISTVLPVIQTLSLSSTESPGLELDTVAKVAVVGDLPAELGGNLKVSGCNVYGQFYKINDKVTVLSKTCRECVCSPDGIACNAIC